jgi:hypothetical protein
MSVKIRVNFEKPTSNDLVNPAAPKMGVLDKAPNPCQRLEEIDEG